MSVTRIDTQVDCGRILRVLQSVPITQDGVGLGRPYRTPRDLPARMGFGYVTGAALRYLPPGYELMSMWANRMDAGSRVGLHDHTGRDTGSELSGCLFLTASNSRLVFPGTTPPTFVAPYPGLLVIFASNLKHYVETNNSPVPRWSVAFNARQAVPGVTLGTAESSRHARTQGIGVSEVAKPNADERMAGMSIDRFEIRNSS